MTAPQQILVCGNREPQNGSIARWDKTSWDGAQWVAEPTPVQLTINGPDWCRQAFVWAVQQWMKVCAIEVEWESNPRNASIVVTEGHIDGPSGTLAWMQLPYGPDRQLSGKIDTTDSWHNDPLSDPSRGRIHSGAVLGHEFAHALGVEHVPTSLGVALLNPMYRADVLAPQPLDVKQAVLRYGPKITAPTPDSGDPPAGLAALVLPYALPAGRYHLTKQ